MPIQRFQISLKSLFFIVLACTPWLAKIHYQRRNIAEQRLIVEQLAPFGVDVSWNSDGVSYLRFEPVPSQRRLSDADVVLLKRFQDVWAVDLRNTSVTDVGVSTLYEMRRLWLVILPEATVSPKKAADLERHLERRSPGARVFFRWGPAKQDPIVKTTVDDKGDGKSCARAPP